jgi:dipeptidyl aminopeptidase/acylaminoacyl peptidase
VPVSHFGSIEEIWSVDGTVLARVTDRPLDLGTQDDGAPDPSKPPGQGNNNDVDDLRNGLSAVIDELDRRGLVDRTRLAIGGHGYGAFTTVNAVVDTPFFKAGVAGDGACNRTLTPIGFQSERRDLRDAPRPLT